MGLHLSEEFWIAADALAGHRMMQSPTQQQVTISIIIVFISYSLLGRPSEFC